MTLTDDQLCSLEQWAACDLGKTEGDEVQALVDEVRRLRAFLDRRSVAWLDGRDRHILASVDAVVRRIDSTCVRLILDGEETDLSPWNARELGMALAALSYSPEAT